MEKVNVYVFKNLMISECVININTNWNKPEPEYKYYKSKYPGILYKLLKDLKGYIVYGSMTTSNLPSPTSDDYVKLTNEVFFDKSFYSKEKKSWEKRVSDNLQVPLSRINFIECFDKIIIEER